MNYSNSTTPVTGGSFDSIDCTYNGRNIVGTGDVDHCGDSSVWTGFRHYVTCPAITVATVILRALDRVRGTVGH